jgi:uncharacterized membrane protein
VISPDTQQGIDKGMDKFSAAHQDKPVSGSDRFTLWISRNYMFGFILLIALYIGTPFVAPILMKTGMQAPARMIYMIYSPLCHQLAFRSWFLFGEQPVYPLEAAHIDELVPYENYTNQAKVDLLGARNFVGNETMGYKVALCERDVAIYVALLFFAIVFALSGRRIKSLPWYLWVAIGLVPIAVDGLSQLPSLASGLIPYLPIVRESTPILRTITGVLFGFCTGWYMFPLIEESMNETTQIVKNKYSAVSPKQENQN